MALASGFRSGEAQTGVSSFAVDTTLSIGRESGPEPYLLHRVANAMRLPAGEIVVANCGTNELRIFDHAGRHVRSFGRTGEGPGEFLRLLAVFRAGGDSIGAYDWERGRVQLFTPDGVVRREIRIRFRLRVRARMPGGDFIATVPDVSRLARSPGRAQASRDHAWIMRLSPDGTVVDSIGPLLGQVRAHLLAAIAVASRTAPQPTTALERLLGAPRRDTLPAFRGVKPGAGGVVWVQDGSRQGGISVRWTAYRGATAIATVRLPPLFFPSEFGENDVVGVSWDSVGVERVMVLRLVPSVESASASASYFTPRLLEYSDCLGGLE